MPFFDNSLDLALPSVFASSVQGFPAKTAIRPTVAAGSPSWANRQHKAVPQQGFEVLVRYEWCAAVLWGRQHEGSSSRAAVGSEVGSLIVAKGGEECLLLLASNLVAQDALELRHGFIQHPLPVHLASAEAASLSSYGFLSLIHI